MTDFGDNKHVDGVPDPYYSGSKGFELVLDILENSVKGLIKKIEDDIRQDYKKSN
jgi:protein-tyrosine phosphatase